MNIIDILFAKKLGGGSPFPPVIKRVTGNPVEFTDGADAPLVKCTTTIQGYQEGTGTPSPDNVRPIHAYTESTISVGGKNLFDESETRSSEFSNDNGVYTNTNTDTKTDFTLRIQAVKNGVVVRTPISGTVYTTTGYKSTTFTIPDGTDYDTLRIKHNGSSRDLIIDYSFNKQGTFALSFDLVGCNSSVVGGLVIKNIQLEEGSTATPYEPYTKTDHTATFSNSIYQGNADFVGESVRADCGVFSISDYVWSGSNGAFYTVQVANLIKHGDGRYDHCICECYATEDVPSTTQLSDGAMSVDNNGYVQIKDTRYTLSSAFMAAMGSYKIAYELATPTTETITPTNLPIKSLFGYNHIESSTGEMVVDYITDAYQEFVDTTERAIPSTRKSGLKAFDIFQKLDEPKKPEAPAEEGKPEEEVLKK